MFKYITIALLCMLVFIVTGCSAKSVIKSLVEKSYNVTCRIENVVQESDTEELITTVKLFETPLKVLKTAVDFMSSKVKDEKIKVALLKASATIDDINKAIESLNPQTIDATKAEIIIGLEELKVALKFIGQYVGAEFDKVIIAANSDPKKNLEDAAKDLEDLLQKVQ